MSLMKTLIVVFLALVAVGLPVRALDDVVMLPTKKTLDASREREGGNTTVRESEVVYNVKVTSKTFKELRDVVIKYNIIYKDEQFGSTAKPEIKSISGKHKIDLLITNKPVEFETEPVNLSRESLDGNWYFTGGGNRSARDRVVGLWFKAFNADGEQIGEYANPSSVIAKQKWKD